MIIYRPNAIWQLVGVVVVAIVTGVMQWRTHRLPE